MKVFLLVIGALATVIAVGVLAAGAALLVAPRDRDGYVTSRPVAAQTSTYALVSERVDLGESSDTVARLVPGDPGSVRVRVDAAGRRPLFAGIATQADVEAYLAGVPFEVLSKGGAAFRTSHSAPDGNVPAPPTSQTFWLASTQGTGAQTLDWKLRTGQWKLVVMNVDATPGVAATLKVGFTAEWLMPLARVLTAVALVALALGIALIVVGGLYRFDERTVLQPVAYPLTVEARLDEPLSRWRWLVKWLLALPHAIILPFLWVAFGVLTAVAFVAILTTGRYPAPLFATNVGILRWTWRVGYYAYSVLGTDRYPAFTLREVEDYPARIAVAYPERLVRGLALVKWLLALPHSLVIAFFAGAGVGPGRGNGGGYQNFRGAPSCSER